MTKQTVDIVLVGIGGYGEVYLSALLDEPPGASCRIAGAVDPRPENCSRLADLRARGVCCYGSLRDFYREGAADLAVISSPIQLHTEHVQLALEHGSHVLVEKPAAAVTADVDAMIQARDAAAHLVAVGFQWSFAESILALKADIRAGRFGRPLGGRSLTLWPRTETYYGRNRWAGRRRDGNGRWILDSPASNAMGHFLHNLLFLLGPEMDRSAEPADVTARLGRVNDIETFDTVAARVHTDTGAELLFLASHAVAEEEAMEPRFALSFEDASVSFSGEGEQMVARFHDGDTEVYASPNATGQVAKLWTCVSAIRDAAADGNAPCSIPCGLETARPHTVCIERIESGGTKPTVFSDAMERISDTAAGRLHWVPGLAADLVRSYEAGEWPSLLE